MCAALALLCACGRHEQQPAQAVPHKGAALYREHCAACHETPPKPAVIGPSLHGIHTRKTHAQIVELIESPAPPMPKLYPDPLSDADVEAIASYVETL